MRYKGIRIHIRGLGGNEVRERKERNRATVFAEYLYEAVCLNMAIIGMFRNVGEVITPMASFRD
jgi:hypothetical protein